MRSRLSELEYSENVWVVSLMRGPASNHAQIIVEGIDDEGNSFSKFAHFVGPGTLRNPKNCLPSYSGWSRHGIVKGFKDINWERFQIGASESWPVNKDRALHMIRRVQIEDNKNRSFNILGRHSIYHNTYFIFLKILLFCLLAFHIENHEKFPLSGLLAIALTCLAGFNIFNETERSGTEYGSRTLNIEKMHYNLLAYNQESRESIEHAQELLKGLPDNCVTWAQQKLNICGIKLQFSALNNFVSITSEITDAAIITPFLESVKPYQIMQFDDGVTETRHRHLHND
ncbi:MAG: hypothetical protein K0R66_1593 [Gammaproteobacteria bacterium]|jgi:hypothetical protein|nr:hypothetical protein [Gammaproteobacteria bacterium]